MTMHLVTQFFSGLPGAQDVRICTCKIGLDHDKIDGKAIDPRLATTQKENDNG